ncbi:DNA-binding MarR family transcriptional regulator [Yoonia maricola]|uniref:DNA-binding MarR family transcriptional regulator n=1 Tax=Yoonia maricola TaxID=420999 RepID=A0A2M8WPR4_9RHOB|nr:MarR family transcriptional regulator [Yoonia maricola]PJI92922.1 DNA-binding MarR family transcriptional regulator [Yoonia maricola]
MVKVINAEDKALDSLNVASRAVYIAVDVLEDTIAAQLGVHRSDLRCLNVLGKGSLTATEIARQTGLTSGAVTALIDRLEKARFVERTRSLTDRRSVVVAIRPEAYPSISSLYSHIGHALSRQFSASGKSDITVSTEVLITFSEACREAVRTMTKDTQDVQKD